METLFLVVAILACPLGMALMGAGVWRAGRTLRRGKGKA